MRSRTSTPAWSRARGNRKARRWSPRCSNYAAVSEWRGLGLVPYSALRIKSAYAGFDTEALRCRRSRHLM